MNKQTQKAMFSSNSGEWETPQDLFDVLDKEFRFKIDLAASVSNTKVPECYYTKEIDALSQEWLDTVAWCNPPYGRDVGKWVAKAHESAKEHRATIVMLLPARTDTKWFHDYIYQKHEVRFLRGRLKFGGSANSAPFPSMVVVFK